MAKDDLDEKFIAFLKNMTPAKQDELSKQVQAMMKEDVEFEKQLDKARRKGLKTPNEMVFEVKFIVTCTTCGSQHISAAMSSSTKDIVHAQPLCGRCREVLMLQPLDELVKVILEREKLYHGRPHMDYMPQYIPPCEVVYITEVVKVTEIDTVEQLNELFDTVVPDVEVEE